VALTRLNLYLRRVGILGHRAGDSNWVISVDYHDVDAGITTASANSSDIFTFWSSRHVRDRLGHCAGSKIHEKENELSFLCNYSWSNVSSCPHHRYMGLGRSYKERGDKGI